MPDAESGENARKEREQEQEARKEPENDMYNQPGENQQEEADEEFKSV